MDQKIIQYFSHFIVTCYRLLKLTEPFHGNLKKFQKKSIKTLITSDNSSAPKVTYDYGKKLQFDGIILRQVIISFIHRDAVNTFIIYELDTWSRDFNTFFTLGYCSFGTVKLTKNADLDKYGYSGYGIGFNARSQFSWLNDQWGKNATIFGVGNSSSLHIDLSSW